MAEQEAAQEAAEGRRRMIERVRERKEAHRQRGRVYRIAFGIAAVLVVCAGIALSLPGIPGPGLVVVAVGLGMLALEFAWAERLLERVLDQLERAGESIGRANRAQKAAAAAAVVAAVGALAAVAVVWDVPVLPV